MNMSGNNITILLLYQLTNVIDFLIFFKFLNVYIVVLMYYDSNKTIFLVS